MAIPVWTVGQVLTASDVNNWLVPASVFKPGDQSVTSSTTLVNDNDLLLPVAANADYRFECWLSFIAVAGGDIKWTWSVPSGAALAYVALHNEGGGTGFNNSGNTYADTDTVSAAGGSPTVTTVFMRGHLSVGSTSGTIRLKWAQGTSNASATHVRGQSDLHLDRVG